MQDLLAADHVGRSHITREVVDAASEAHEREFVHLFVAVSGPVRTWIVIDCGGGGL